MWLPHSGAVSAARPPNELLVAVLAVVHSHQDSVFALRIFFSVCLALVLLAGVLVFRRRRQLFFDPDPEVVADHWAVRNLRLWQVIFVWLLAVELLVTMLCRL